MFRRVNEQLPLTPGLRAMLYRPLVYRLTTPDLLLPGAFIASIGMLLTRNWLAGGDQKVAMALLLVSFFVLVLSLNRAAWLLSGRGGINQRRMRFAIDRLLAGGELEILPWAAAAALPLDEVLAELDRYMAEEYHLGYLDTERMRMVLSDQPVVNRRCPVCGAILSDTMVVEKVCGLCGTMLYT
ncbi:MAG TPA: hypothetical protein PLD82_09970 [Spirochaetota bacterium]|nr:hypothetical protein [Spirochaetota bacterium]